jgi:hypothetical protein
VFNGCGEAVNATGVVVRKLDVARERVGAAPGDLSAREFFDGTLQRVKLADVVGDGAEETIVELPRGQGVEIRGAAGVIDEIVTDEYLTDFDTISIEGFPKRQLILYTYPNSTRGGTFRIVTMDGREIANWTEHPPPERLAVARWKGVETVFYIRGDELIRRSSSGSELPRLLLPSAGKFSTLQIAQAADERLIVLASGDGYTPYHMVCIYSSSEELVYQEIGSEHAFQLEADASRTDFVVFTRSTQWHFVPRAG